MPTRTITLRPTGRRRVKLGQASVIATVAFDERPSNNYRHPVVHLYRQFKDGTTDTLATLRFQQHRVDSETYGSPYVSAGFRRMPGWSHCYGMTLEADVESKQDRDAIVASVRWLAQAGVATSDRWRSRSGNWSRSKPTRRQEAERCDLLMLVVGLRLIGIPVTVPHPSTRWEYRVHGGHGSLAVAS